MKFLNRENYRRSRIFLLLLIIQTLSLQAQQVPVKGNDTNVPLHALPPAYKTPYGTAKPEDIKMVLDRVFTYLDATTPAELVNSKTGEVIRDLKTGNKDAIVRAG